MSYFCEVSIGAAQYGIRPGSVCTQGLVCFSLGSHVKKQIVSNKSSLIMTKPAQTTGTKIEFNIER